MKIAIINMAGSSNIQDMKTYRFMLKYHIYDTYTHISFLLHFFIEKIQKTTSGYNSVFDLFE